MYINKSLIYVRLAIWSVIFVFAFTFSFAFIGVAFENIRDPLCIAMFAIAAFLIFLVLNYVKNMRYILRLQNMDKCLAADADGLVPMDELATYLNTDRARLDRMIVFAEKKKLLINLVVDKENDRLVLTDKFNPENAMKERPFIGMNCPGCAAPLKLRAATTGECPFCGRQVTAPNIMIGNE